MKAKTADYSNIEVVVARTKYPQGAEKMLIKRVTGKTGSQRRPAGGCGLCRQQYQHHKGDCRRDSEGYAPDRARCDGDR